MKKTLAMLLAVVMVLGLFAGCAAKPTETTPATNGTEPTEPALVVQTFEGNFTYQDSVSTLATNWNPHTYQTTDDSYPADFLRVGLYSFMFNDELNPVEGKDPYAGYVIVPEMAASKPVDVTEQVKAEHPEFNIPESATAGYAYTIDLNPAATWENGKAINADTYVESMKRLLDAKLLNYRASDYYAGDFCIAGAEAYANSGRTVKNDNGVSGAIAAVADLVKNEDGTYSTAEGGEVYLAVRYGIDWCSGNSLGDYVDAYGADYFGMDTWADLDALCDEEGLIRLTDDVLALFIPVITGNPNWGETEADVVNYLVYNQTYPEVDFSTAGLYKTGEYQITLVLGKSLGGFNLLYNLTSNWIVEPELYDANLKENNGVWSSTYNTNVATTLSYGPYKMTEYQTDKFMKFEKNENWYGYTDGKHIYKDPTDGLIYPMYQTNIVETEVVAEAETRKMMFLKGELMGYGLGAEDFATYRSSEFCYASPGSTIFFLILNGNAQAIANREASEGFDKATQDLEMLTNTTFHKALGLAYDKDNFAATISPARSGAFGIIGDAYIYDPETGARYRDTDQAKQVLCDFYSVDVSKFANLTEAADSITGYDPEMAKTYFQQAFDEAIAAGYITDADGNGISDQTVAIEYCISQDSDFMTKTIDYLNEKVTEVAAGTPFEGKINFYKSGPYGNEWSNKIKQGVSDTVLGGWSGSLMNPFGLTDLYTNPSYQYDAAWYDSSKIDLTVNVPVNGVDTDLTMTLRNWSDALNGATVTVDGVEYNFGEANADVETRLDILAAIEGKVLESYNYLPMLLDGSMALLSQQVYYVVEDYNPVLGRGGIQYMKYNYNDAEWAAYVAEQGGELKY